MRCEHLFPYGEQCECVAEWISVSDGKMICDECRIVFFCGICPEPECQNCFEVE